MSKRQYSGAKTASLKISLPLLVADKSVFADVTETPVFTAIKINTAEQ
jgi:hypothetical protein